MTTSSQLRLIFLPLALLSAHVYAADKPATRSTNGSKTDLSSLSIDRIFGKKEFAADKVEPPCWLDDSHYAMLEDSLSVKDGKEIVRYELPSGKRKVLVPATSLMLPDESKPMEIDSFSWSDDGKTVLLFTNSKRVWRQNTRGDYWAYDLSKKQLKKLGGDGKPSTMMFGSLSPDGSRIAFVRQNNIYVQNLSDLRITQLSTDGSETIINGTSDWVNEEELDLRMAYRWSPNGKQIAYWQFDTSGVHNYTLVNDTDTPYEQNILVYKYPKVGEMNSACRVGVVAATGGTTTWMNTHADPRNHYIPEMEWALDSHSIYFEQLNRLQNTNLVIQGDAATGDVRTIFVDQDEAFLDANVQLRWIGKGKRFLWLSERDGWRHLYAVASDGQSTTLLTPGKFDVIRVAGVDAQQGCVYFLASPENPTQAYLYRASLDGSKAVSRVTPKDQPGTHIYNISPGGRWAMNVWSRFDQPPISEIVKLPDHSRVRLLSDNAKLRNKLAQLDKCPSEFFRVDIGHVRPGRADTEPGVQLDAYSIKPPHFDPAKKYPLLIYVYGEPASATVVDHWTGNQYLWYCMLAQQGYVVMSFENRGTETPRGRDWRKSIYRQIGILASADQAAALRQVLKQDPYIDPKRVGIWGWSGGGSMSLNAIFRYPKLYRMAMAIAFISDERLYDTIYQERYMGLPDDNKLGYKNGSPITFAHQLEGDLLLVHGTGDDNCHYQSCEMLVNKLVKCNRQFSMMTYPNRSHGIFEGENTTRHLYETLTRYLHEHLPAEPAQ
jgi:dipeptidyl-peptidase-4